jgi:hypothetical protein
VDGPVTTAYAATTTVTSDRSRTEIERLLVKYGATQFAYGWAGDQAMIAFVMRDRQIRFLVPMPDENDKTITHTPEHRRRTLSVAKTAYDQAVRSRWRSLALVIKAKLEAVNSGIVTFEDEWATHMVLPDNTTVRDRLFPVIEQAYATGTVPAMLALGPS